eukprot:GEMP01029039.1.p1 GENE.GEMP01029039.1~~GEMP01029039.1.p1  ORF type:complete len:269 (+),score=49.49 GEMP01029039.1:54-860(+)
MIRGRPRAVTCDICFKPFFPASFGFHRKVCLQLNGPPRVHGHHLFLRNATNWKIAPKVIETLPSSTEPCRVDEELISCTHCARTFAQSRIRKHQVVCQGKRVSVFPSQRTYGSEISRSPSRLSRSPSLQQKHKGYRTHTAAFPLQISSHVRQYEAASSWGDMSRARSRSTEHGESGADWRGKIFASTYTAGFHPHANTLHCNTGGNDLMHRSAALGRSLDRQKVARTTPTWTRAQRRHMMEWNGGARLTSAPPPSSAFPMSGSCMWQR